MSAFTIDRSEFFGRDGLFIDGGKGKVDDRGTYLHLMGSDQPNGKGNVAYLRMGSDDGRHLNREEATAVRDALNDFLEAAK